MSSLDTSTTTTETLTIDSAVALLKLSPEEVLLFELSRHHRFQTDILYRNQPHPDILYIQKALVVLGFLSPQEVTGHYDSQMKNGLELFQKSKNIRPYNGHSYGYFDEATREALNTALQDKIRPFQNRLANKLHTLHKKERRRKFWTGGGGMVMGAVGTIGLALAAVFALKDDLHLPGNRDTTDDVPELSPAQQKTKVLARRIDNLELPDGISNMGAIFYIANPVVEPQSMLLYDTLIDYQTVGEKLLQGKFLLMGVDEGDSLPLAERLKKRVYRFTIPSEDTGEKLAHNHKEMMGKVTWPDALNLLMQGSTMSDDAVFEYLQWWYQRTYSISLNKLAFRLERAKDGTITDVLYNDVETIVPFDKIKILPGLPSTSRHSNRTTQTTPKPLTQNGKLLLWTGVNQDLAIPEEFLTKGFVVDHTLPNGAAIRFTTDELAESLRIYLSARDTDQVFNGRDNVGRFVTKDDPIIKRLVKAIIGTARNPAEKRERIRVFAQKLTYRSETQGVEVNRPAIATYLQEWGDCNNLAVFLATLYATAGDDVGLFYLERTPEQRRKVRSDSRYFSSHIAPALRRKPDMDGRYYTVPVGTENREWMAVEATGPSEFGEEDYENGWDLTVKWIQELQPPQYPRTAQSHSSLIVSTNTAQPTAPHGTLRKMQRFAADTTRAGQKCRRVIRDGTSSPQTPTLFKLGAESCNIFRVTDIAEETMLLPFEEGDQNVQKGFVYNSGDPTHGSLEVTLRIAQDIDDGATNMKGLRFDAEIVESLPSAGGYRVLTDSTTMGAQASWMHANSNLFTGTIPDGASCMTATTFPEEISHRPFFPCTPDMTATLEIVQKAVQETLDAAKTK